MKLPCCPAARASDIDEINRHCIYRIPATGMDKENIESPAVKLGNPKRELYVMCGGILTQLSMALSGIISCSFA